MTESAALARYLAWLAMATPQNLQKGLLEKSGSDSRSSEAIWRINMQLTLVVAA
ncbi:hypothetical protein D3C85_1877980 [compost metagenome]